MSMQSYVLRKNDFSLFNDLSFHSEIILSNQPNHSYIPNLLLITCILSLI